MVAAMGMGGSYAQVRGTPCRPGSWANSSPLQLCSRVRGPAWIFSAGLTPLSPQHAVVSVAQTIEHLEVRTAALPHCRSVLLFILVFGTHVRTTNIPCMQTLLLCTTARPLHTRFTNIFGTSIYEATVRPPSTARHLNENCTGLAQIMGQL
jgi:hypothetical protein